MTPIAFLVAVVGVTLIAATLEWGEKWLHRRKLQQQAKEWGMHFASNDRFRLLARVAEQLPEIGAADVRVSNIIYGLDHEAYRYILTAEFTTGVLRSKKRRRHVGMLRESRSQGGGEFSPLVLADRNQSILGQYRELHERALLTNDPAAPKLQPFSTTKA